MSSPFPVAQVSPFWTRCPIEWRLFRSPGRRAHGLGPSNAAIVTRPSKTSAERSEQMKVCLESATAVAETSFLLVRRSMNERKGMTTTLTAASLMPTLMDSGVVTPVIERVQPRSCGPPDQRKRTTQSSTGVIPRTRCAPRCVGMHEVALRLSEQTALAVASRVDDDARCATAVISV